jgi:hypothetical protein
MMRTTLFFIILAWIQFSAGTLFSQENKFGPCSQPMGWDRITVSEDPLPEGTRKFLVVTCRPFITEPAEGEYFPNEIAEFRKVTYLVAACNGKQWQLRMVDDFRSGMHEIDRGEDLLLFIHGHGQSLPQSLTRSDQILSRYDVSMVVFDWPSYNSNFNKSLSRVRRCSENYYNLLLQMKDYRETSMKSGQHLSMLLHSLGNYYLTYQVVNGNCQYMKEKIFDNIIMNAAAVRSKEHGEVVSQLAIQDRIYVTFNHMDKVLRGAHLLTTGKMLGNVVIEPLAGNAIYADFSCVAGTQHTYFTGYHDFEYSLPAFSRFFDTAFKGGEVDFSDSGMFKKKEEGPIYLIANPAEPDCRR